MNAYWRPPVRAGRIVVDANAVLFGLTAFVLSVAMLLGGATRFNLLQMIIVELASLPLLAYLAWRLSQAPLPKELRLPAILLAAAYAILILQLIPLPYGLWSHLPGHQLSAEAEALMGAAKGWAPISLNPEETRSHLLAMLPPSTVFLGTALLSARRRKWMTLFPLAIAVISVCLGAAQLAGGADNSLYFYPSSNTDSAIGLFANRNHQASLLVSSLPLAALWMNLDRRQARRNMLPVALVLGIFLMEIVALIVVKSRAGVLLLAPTLIASLLLAWRSEGGEGRRGVTLLGGVVGIALLVGIAFGIGPVLDRFAAAADDVEMGGRLTAAITTTKAALHYLPFGSGGGTFVQAFTGFESVENMGPKFWNHAHNDFLEIILETGVFGILALLGFLFWVARRALAAWFRATSTGSNLACAGSIVVGLLLLHSTIDYPLRTLSLACLFAFACGLLVNSGEEVRRSRR